LLHGSFLLFNPTNFGHSRTLMEKSCQTIQLIGGSGSVDLYSAVGFVSHPALQADLERVFLDEVAEPDPLHTSRDKPAARLGHHFFSATIREDWRRRNY
jgi:hypothetical protein